MLCMTRNAAKSYLQSVHLPTANMAGAGLLKILFLNWIFLFKSDFVSFEVF